MPYSGSSPSYMIYHPEKLCLLDILCILILGRSRVVSEFIESSSSALTPTVKGGKVGVVVLSTSIIQKILLWISPLLSRIGDAVEYILNLISLNGGFLGLLRDLITGSLKRPQKGSVDYRSTMGHLDGRRDLYIVPTVHNHKTKLNLVLDNANEISRLDLSMMAAKIAYENPAYVEDVVTNHWKMYLVGQYNFWNEFLESEDTQAFICCDRQSDAQLILVAFRGTEPFNGRDWVTDIDLSWMSMGDMGRVHVGFMKALGLQDQEDYKKGWPRNYTGSKKLAYYTIRDTLKKLIEQNKGAKIIITGHSLGGALAILFPSVLVLHEEDDIMSSVMGVYTFGQPRVGDQVFGDFMKARLNVMFTRYVRVVYRYDIVPRIPFREPLGQFAHFGGCFYYRSWYEHEVLREAPNPNYFDAKYLPSKFLNAWLDLFRGLFAWIRPGNDFKESFVSILVRVVGLLIPGLASHSPRDYVNGGRLAKATPTDVDDDDYEYDDEDELSGF